jgi:hypothetical protein
MSTSPDGPQKRLTVQDVDAWLLTTAERYAAIHRKATPLEDQRQLLNAFADMGLLSLEAFEEVRVVSEQLREESQATRSKTIALVDHHAQLLEQSTAAMERLAQFLPPPPEAIR